MPSRRGFIGAGVTALAALELIPMRALAQGTSGLTKTDTLGFEDFTAMRGSRFYLVNYSGPDHGKVKLIAVEIISINSVVEQFQLQLRGNRRTTLPEGLYATTNWGGYPNFDIHLQWTGTDKRGRALYLANFALLQG